MLRWLSRSRLSLAILSPSSLTSTVRNTPRSLSTGHTGLRSADKSGKREPPINDDIAIFPRVRLIAEDGEDRGEMSGYQAVQEARKAQRDVLTVHRPKSLEAPPVVRLVDYAALVETKRRNTYSARKDKRESARVDRKSTILKQVRLSPSIDEHDFQLKLKQARNFLLEGYRLRLFMQFRRGQGRLQDNAKESLSRAAKELVTYGSLVGSMKGTDVIDLFPPKSADAEDAESGSVSVTSKQKSKPLEVLLQPLRKKDRERLVAGSDGNESEPMTVVDQRVSDL
jgi:translation initiation factor IF-3